MNSEGHPESVEIAALRAEIASLGEMVAGRLAKVFAEQAAVTGRMADLGVDQDEAADAVARLEESLSALIAIPAEASEGAEAGEVPEPAAWVDAATADEWVALADWVDWLIGTYDLAEARRIRPCWPAHLGVVEELAALRSAWRDAAGRARGLDNDALAFWHDRYLATFLARVNHQYGTLACHATRHTPVMPAPVSDRTLIDVRSASTKDQDELAAVAAP